MTAIPSTAAITPSGPTIREMYDSITGNDELQILDAFGSDVWDDYDVVYDELADEAPPKRIQLLLLRKLIFAHKLHDGLPPSVAKTEVLALPVPNIMGYFTRDPESEPAVDQADGETPDGEDDSAAGKGVPAGD